MNQFKERDQEARDQGREEERKSAGDLNDKAENLVFKFIFLPTNVVSTKAAVSSQGAQMGTE